MKHTHIPWLDKISDFYRTFRIGKAHNDFFTIMRIEDQAKEKLLYMPLFRGNFHRLLICKTAGLRFLLPEETVSTSKNSIYFAYPGKVESWQRVETIYGYLICFTPAFAQIDPSKSCFEKNYPFFMENASSILKITPEEMDSISTTAELLLTEIESNEPDRFEMISSLLKRILIQIRRIHQKDKSSKTDFQLRQASIMMQFRKALNKYFSDAPDTRRQKPTVSKIATELHITPSYLNFIVKKTSGHTASDHINEKLILEAKSMLMHSDLQVAEIAHLLQFSDPPYFNRFFKKLTGQTPNQFRIGNQNTMQEPLLQNL